MKDKVKLGLRASFPWFGGKRRIANKVWERFGDVSNYVEPFAGSVAMLLARPHQPHFETVNDIDGFISNYYRAVIGDPISVAKWCDFPVNEIDLYARHKWLIKYRSRLRKRLEDDPDFYSTKIAGWWVWGQCIWLAGGWCIGKKATRVLPNLTSGKGVITMKTSVLQRYIHDLSIRLKYVRITCGDWKRILGPTPTENLGVTAVFLDPPYGDDRSKVYAIDDTKLYLKVRDWAIEHGSNFKLRIALCGYETQFDMPDDWTCIRWKTAGGYSVLAKKHTRAKYNARKEIVWFSPHCLTPRLGLLERVLDERRIGR